jgi:RAB6A-GEF complex partner protein 1
MLYSRGCIKIINFPSRSGVTPKANNLAYPVSYVQTGPVCCMQWSTDGYVLAVGWQTGWAVWSVGGRCLAWAGGVEGETDPSK